MATIQEKFWQSNFGDDYSERNAADPQVLNELYLERFGISRSEMNREFLSDKPIKTILEVGCNIGNQLLLLSHQGYSQLTGIEINQTAATIAKQRLPTAEIITSSALKLPFSDRQFDLVFTAGVLIHIHPDNLPDVMGEIVRVSKQYIWGLEYWSKEPTAVNYRGHSERLWKRDFSAYYQQLFPTLTLLKEKRYSYQPDPTLIDSMFILEKREG